MIFADTGAYLSCFCRQDQYHRDSLRIWKELASEKTVTITTNHVIDELATLLARRTSYDFSAGKTEEIYDSKLSMIIRPDQNDELEALKIFKKYADQKISFTDCLSFVVMKNLKIQHVFTFDHHFSIFGFYIIH
ncbi:MAG: type II toxin-antitoxin system VapC family toxin [Desulfococcaceae bacterium]